MNAFLNKKWVTTVRIPFFGSTGTLDYLKFLSFVSPKDTNRNCGKSQREVTFEFVHEYQANNFTVALVRTFNPSFIEFATDCVPMFNSSWEHLEAMVKAHDLYHEMSDDHRVWQSGQAELTAIKNLANKLAIIDKERVRGIVKRIFKITV